MIASTVTFGTLALPTTNMSRYNTNRAGLEKDLRGKPNRLNVL
jgi:hypothetical protein